MGQMLVRNIDDDVLLRLKAKAKASGTSLEEVARAALREAAKPCQEDIWAEVDRIRAMSHHSPVDSTILIARIGTTMNLIVDASVAVKEAGSAPARDLVCNGPRLFAPDLILLEIGNALRKKLARGLIGLTQAAAGISAVERAFTGLTGTRTLSDAAVKLAFELNHPVYDCVYLALASREDFPLVTADRKLFEAGRRAKIEARLL